MRQRVRQVWARLRRPASFLLVPLSGLPLVVATPLIAHAHTVYLRYYLSPPYPAPGNVLSAKQERAFTPLPAFSGAIPVIAYHGIGAHAGPGGITRRAFVAQMEMLRLAGFRTVSIAQYDRFERGDASGLPSRPILITFDDGRLDSYRAADQVLAREGFRATMFVITGAIVDRDQRYLDWTELHRMARSGRWDVQPETYDGHEQVTVDPQGDERPYYAMRRYLRSTGEETFAAYQRRVATDLFELVGQFHAQGFAIHAIAVPYGDYGQLDRNDDPRVVQFVLGLLKSQFGNVFAADPHGAPRWNAATGGGPQDCWIASASATPEQLYAWLRSGDPATTTPTAANLSAGRAATAAPVATAPAAGPPVAVPVTRTTPQRRRRGDTHGRGSLTRSRHQPRRGAPHVGASLTRIPRQPQHGVHHVRHH